MYLAIDIGGTFIKYALMDTAGNILTKNKKPSKTTNLADFEQSLYSIMEEHDLSSIKGIAISCPGTVDVHTGTIYYGGSFPFLHEVSLSTRMEEKYGINTTVENDGKCAALAELWLGSIKGKQQAVVLVLGSGVGGGIIIDGKLHRGINMSAGELSYVMNHINNDSKKASFFGYHGSAVKMVQQIADRKNIEDRADGQSVFQYINENDEDAMKVFNQYCINLAVQIMNLQYILDPEIIAIGGGISSQPIVLEKIKWAIQEIKTANPFHMANPNIVECKFRNDANLYGALYHFFTTKEKLVIK